MADENEKPRRDHRQEVTDEIVAMLEKGTAPWQKPWDPTKANTALDGPRNAITGREYRGANSLYLTAKALSKGYEDPRWLTYKQANEAGAQVNKGEKATYIESWTFDEEKRVRQQDGSFATERVKLDKPKVFHHAVFNAAQVEGLAPYQAPEAKQPWETIAAADAILEGSKAKILHDQADRAFYSPKKDEIHLPPYEAFPSSAAYYGTALHELGHWTGHESRLNREGVTGGHLFGSEGYAKEELRAEIASVFIQRETGVSHAADTRETEQHAAYVGSWIKTLKEDKNEIFRASIDANKIADHVIELGREKLQEAVKEIREADRGYAGSIEKRSAETHKETKTEARTWVTADVGDLSKIRTQEATQAALLDIDTNRSNSPKYATLLKELHPQLDDRVTAEAKRNELAIAAKEERKLADMEKMKASEEQGRADDKREAGYLAEARRSARGNQIIELTAIGAVAYIDKRTNEFTIEAESAKELAALVDKHQDPRAVTVTNAASIGKKIAFANAPGDPDFAKSEVQAFLVNRGVDPEDAQTVAGLANTTEQARPGAAFSREELSESFKGAREQLQGADATNKLYIPKPDAQYKGEIVSESPNGLHLIQRVNQHTHVAHIKTNFKEPPEQGKPLNITYKGGRVVGVAEAQPKKDREKAVER